MPTTVSVSSRSLVTWVFLLTVLSAVLIVVAFATTGWMVWGSAFDSNHSERGLWKQCSCGSLGSGVPDWHKGIQALVTMGMACVLFSLILVLIYTCCAARRVLAIMVACFLFIAVAFLVIAFVIVGVKLGDYHHSVGWSFGMAVASSIVALVAGILAIADLRGCVC